MILDQARIGKGIGFTAIVVSDEAINSRHSISAHRHGTVTEFCNPSRPCVIDLHLDVTRCLEFKLLIRGRINYISVLPCSASDTVRPSADTECVITAIVAQGIISIITEEHVIQFVASAG